LPNKLSVPFGGVPLLERVIRNVAPAAPELIIAGDADVEPALTARYRARAVADMQPRLGPLAGLISAIEGVRARFAFVVAGDAPFVDATLSRALVAAWRSGDEAVVPVRMLEGVRRIEPLAALYDLTAVRRESVAARAAGGSMHNLIERLRARFVTLDVAPHTFANVNTHAEYESAIALLQPPDAGDSKGLAGRV
jgi:molybdopterin-guanine dinucleotide biosynthesis protein A